MITLLFLFFFNDTATTEIYTLSLHDALPIYPEVNRAAGRAIAAGVAGPLPPVLEEALADELGDRDRKSTRLNSSHRTISYAVFCLKKKKKKGKIQHDEGVCRRPKRKDE